MNAATPPPRPARKLGLKDRYRHLTRGLDWELSYQDKDKVFPFADYEGIKIHDWDAFEDPFRLTMDAYWKFQAEKERKLYAVIDSFAQNNGQVNLTDARYVNALKLFITGISPLEYGAHRGFAHVGRHFPGVGPRIACQMQSIDELRHTQTQVHTISHFNKYFDGMHDPWHMYNRVWYLSVPKSFFEDALTAGPFEFLTAISFSFEYVLTSLLFVPFMSGAAYNGDMATVTFGFSAQSDESRHMTLGLEIIKFMLEQDEANVPIVQKWIDKWFWRGFRLLSIVAMMTDYILPKKIMSWKESWEMYFEEAGGALFNDLARYGIRPPKYHEVATAAKDHISHQTWLTFYQYTHAAAFHTWTPNETEKAWFSEKYPDSFDKHYAPRFQYFEDLQKDGKRFYNDGLPLLCQVCTVPAFFTETEDPTRISVRTAEYKGEKYHTCSDGCHDIFCDEPEKYIQARLPVSEIFQGNCGGATLEEVLDWYHLNKGADNFDHLDSRDAAMWEEWRRMKERASA